MFWCIIVAIFHVCSLKQYEQLHWFWDIFSIEAAAGRCDDDTVHIDWLIQVMINRSHNFVTLLKSQSTIRPTIHVRDKFTKLQIPFISMYWNNALPQAPLGRPPPLTATRVHFCTGLWNEKRAKILSVSSLRCTSLSSSSLTLLPFPKFPNTNHALTKKKAQMNKVPINTKMPKSQSAQNSKKHIKTNCTKSPSVKCNKYQNARNIMMHKIYFVIDCDIPYVNIKFLWVFYKIYV